MTTAIPPIPFSPNEVITKLDKTEKHSMEQKITAAGGHNVNQRMDNITATTILEHSLHLSSYTIQLSSFAKLVLFVQPLPFSGHIQHTTNLKYFFLLLLKNRFHANCLQSLFSGKSQKIFQNYLLQMDICNWIQIFYIYIRTSGLKHWESKTYKVTNFLI